MMQRYEWYALRSGQQDKAVEAMQNLIRVQDVKGALNALLANPYGFLEGAERSDFNKAGLQPRETPIATLLAEGSYSFCYQFGAQLSLEQPPSSLVFNPNVRSRNNDKMGFTHFIHSLTHTCVHADLNREQFTQIPAILAGLEANQTIPDASRQLGCHLVMRELVETFPNKTTLNEWDSGSMQGAHQWITGWLDAVEVLHTGQHSVLPICLTQEEVHENHKKMEKHQRLGDSVFEAFLTTHLREAVNTFTEKLEGYCALLEQQQLDESDEEPFLEPHVLTPQFKTVIQAFEKAISQSHQAGWITRSSINSFYEEVIITDDFLSGSYFLSLQRDFQEPEVYLNLLFEALPASLLTQIKAAIDEQGGYEDELFYAIFEASMLRKSISTAPQAPPHSTTQQKPAARLTL